MQLVLTLIYQQKSFPHYEFIPTSIPTHIIIRKQLFLYTGFIVFYSANFAKIFVSLMLPKYLCDFPLVNIPASWIHRFYREFRRWKCPFGNNLRRHGEKVGFSGFLSKRVSNDFVRKTGMMKNLEMEKFGSSGSGTHVGDN